MKHVSFALRICISTGAALAALAPRPGLAESPTCRGPGMAVFEPQAGISAVDSSGAWLRIPPRADSLATVARVENLQPCIDPDIRVEPRGDQLLTWQYEREILSVTSEGTVVTRLPEGETLLAADAAWDYQGRAVIAALVSRDGEDPRLTVLAETWPRTGMFQPPFEVPGANCSAGAVGASSSGTGEVVVLCDGSFTAVSAYEGGINLATFPLALGGAQLVVVDADPQAFGLVTFFAIVTDPTDDVDPAYDLVRISLDPPSGGQNIDQVFDNVAYAGGAHGLAVINELNLVYMDEEGLRHVEGSPLYATWTAEVIHPLRPEAKLSAAAGPTRVLISEYDAELLTLTATDWEHETLFALGTPPGAPLPGDDGGCSVVDPAAGLGQVLLVMLALALVTAPRLARRQGTAHDRVPCPPSSPRPSYPSR
jgi:hypothetical protein